MKPNINSIDIHTQLSNNMHLMDGTLVGVGSLWACVCTCYIFHLVTPKWNMVLTFIAIGVSPNAKGTSWGKLCFC
jgi:hypothetical protein